MRQGEHLLAEQLKNVELDCLGRLRQVGPDRLGITKPVHVIDRDIGRNLTTIGGENPEWYPLGWDLLQRATCVGQGLRHSRCDRSDEGQNVQRLSDVLGLVVLLLQSFDRCRSHLYFLSISRWAYERLQC